MRRYHPAIRVQLTDRYHLDEMWQDTMLGQFHDCLPGTTIKSVVNDNLEIYARRSQQARQLIKEALAVLEASAGTPAGHATSAIDALRLKRDEIIRLDNGKLGRLQTVSNGIGSIVTAPAELQSPQASKDGDVYTVSNARYSLSIGQGRITSLKDLRIGRELIAPGPGADDGGWMLHEDYPLTYDAWDVEIYHLKSFRTLQFDEVKVVEDPLRASLIATSRFGRSVAILTVSSRHPGCIIADSYRSHSMLSTQATILRVGTHVSKLTSIGTKDTSCSNVRQVLVYTDLQLYFPSIFTLRTPHMLPNSGWSSVRHTGILRMIRPSLNAALMASPTLVRRAMVLHWLAAPSMGTRSKAIPCGRYLWLETNRHAADGAVSRACDLRLHQILKRTKGNMTSPSPSFRIKASSLIVGFTWRL